ncbi:MAG: hypothetical protein LBJ41_07395 [Treponema sp.]|nr:hypothetical protein [Treponema sp.]
MAGFQGAKRRFAGVIVSGLLALMLAGCDAMFIVDGSSMEYAIALTLNTWKSGELRTGEACWYEFTATTNAQYIHVVYGTVSALYVQLYDSAGDKMGVSYKYAQGLTTYDALSVTKGKKYYFKVSASDSGAYKIAFADSTKITPDMAGEMASAITLYANTWTRNELAMGAEHWYQFTATADRQYIHVVFGTLRNLHVQVYESNGMSLGGPYTFNQNNDSASLLIKKGEVYYLKVWPRSSSGDGTYEIAFNTSRSPLID